MADAVCRLADGSDNAANRGPIDRAANLICDYGLRVERRVDDVASSTAAEAAAAAAERAANLAADHASDNIADHCEGAFRISETDSATDEKVSLSYRRRRPLGSPGLPHSKRAGPSLAGLRC